MSTMKSLWLSVAKQCQIPSPNAHEIWHHIEQHHTESHRAYHNLNHLRGMFLALEEMVDGEIPTAVSLAVWFHDIIYDPRSQTNEADSAKLMTSLLSRWVEPVRVEETARLIMLTKGHQLDDEGDVNGRALLDADLSILGGNPTQYHTYAEAIRTEYAHVPEKLYHQGRMAVLKHFLDTKGIFLTEYGRQQWEAQARENIDWELAQLKDREQ